MGLFDFLTKIVKKANGQPAEKANASLNNQSKGKRDPTPINPFTDETVQKYYEIIYAMYRSIDKAFFNSDKQAFIAKAYIEKQLNAGSDERKITEALSLFKLSKNSSDKSGKAVFLREFNKELKNKTEFVDTSFDAMRLCFQREVELIEKELNEILEIVGENPSAEILNQGIGKKIIDRSTDFGIKLSTVKFITKKLIQEALCAENAILQEVLVDWLYKSILNNRYRVAMLTSLKIVSLKAVHFEKYGNNRAEYTTITEQDCRTCALSDVEVNKRIRERPFDKGEIVESFVRELMAGIKGRAGTYAPQATYELYTIELIDENDYFFDYLCYLAWKQCIKNNRWKNKEGREITHSNDIADVVEIVISYFYNYYFEE